MISKNKNYFIYFGIGTVIFLEFYGRVFSILLGNRQFELLDDILSLIVLFVIVLFIFQNFKIKHAILNKPLAAFLFIFSLSALFNSVSIDIALMQLRSYLLMIVFYYIIIWRKVSNQEIINIFKLIIIMAIPIFISAIIEYILGRTVLITETRYGIELIQEDVFRSYTLIGNPIDYSNFAIIILSVILASIIEKYSLFKIKKLFLVVIFLIMFFTLFMSNSRGPILAFILTLFIISIFFKIISKKKLFIIGSIFLVVVFFLGDTMIERLTHFNIEVMSTDQYRVLFFIKSIEIFLNNPFFGVGPGMYGGWVSINYSPSYIYEMYGFTTDKISSIDMFFPHLIGELGALGFLSYLGFIIFPFIYFKKIYRSNKDKEVRYISLIVILIVPMLFFIGWFSISLETQLIFSLYMVIIGLAEKYVNNLNKTKKG